jgi:hypothetical protein
VSSLYEEPIFINSSDFYAHINTKHNGVCPNGSSHKLCKYGKEKIHFFRADAKCAIFTHPRMVSIIGDI